VGPEEEKGLKGKAGPNREDSDTGELAKKKPKRNVLSAVSTNVGSSRVAENLRIMGG
jgi:hypothetical protein